MRPSLPEGFGLLASLLTASLLALNSQASTPPPATPEEPVRAALRKAIEEVSAVPDGGKPIKAQVTTLTGIAYSQFRIGDRTAAMATLKRAEAKILPSTQDVEQICLWGQISSCYRSNGEMASARTCLDLMARGIEGIKAESTEPALSDAMAGKSGPALDKIQLFIMLADERRQLGDLQEARALLAQVKEVSKDWNGPLKTMVLGMMGEFHYKSGDAEGGRAAVEELHRAAKKMTNPEVQHLALLGVSNAYCELGEFDRAFDIVQSVSDPKSRQEGLDILLRSYTENDPNDRDPFLDSSGIKITIAAEWLRPKDPAAARRVLPRLASAAESLADPLARARELAKIAHVQAKAGDFSGARQTAESIPALKRADFPAPKDGFYDAIHPAVFGLIARAQSDSGDKAGAKVVFQRAAELSRAVTTTDQRVIAQIVIARHLAATGDGESAIGLVKEAVAVSLKEPEPRRSRSLAMLTETLVQAKDLPEATRVAEATREYPGLERVRAMEVIATAHDAAGDLAASKRVLQQALRCIETEAPKEPKLGAAGKAITSVGRKTFFDYDLELVPTWNTGQRKTKAVTLRARLGDREGALRLIRSLPTKEQSSMLTSLARQYTRQGDTASALEVVGLLELPEVRFREIESMTIKYDIEARHR